MAIQKYSTVAGNAAPDLQLTCKRGTVAIDVTGCTVALIITKGQTITNTGHQACTITTAASGVVTYSPQTGDFPTPGSYKCDLKIVYPGGKPEILYDQLVVKARKAAGA